MGFASGDWNEALTRPYAGKPDFMDFKHMSTFHIDSGKLEKALLFLRPFMSKNSMRYYLEGVFFKKKDNAEITLVATDGYKLCEIILPVMMTDAWECPGVILPAFAVQQFINAAQHAKPTPLVIAYRKEEKAEYLAIRHGDTWFESRCIDGNYPDYEKALPTGEPEKVIGMATEQAKVLAEMHQKENKIFKWEFYKANKEGEAPVIIKNEMMGYRIALMPARME